MSASASGQRTLFPDLENLLAGLKEIYFVRWMKRAQKAALIDWRDRKEAPGLAARFTHGGESFYQFGDRYPTYRKGGLPDYVKTGRLRDAMATRRPRGVRTGSDMIVTRLSYGGGALNFLTDIGPVLESHREVTRISVTVRGYSYQHHRSGATVTVGSSQSTRKQVRWSVTRSGTSYSEEFRRFERDRPYIEAQTTVSFLQIFRSAALTKNGRLRDGKFTSAAIAKAAADEGATDGG